MRSALHLLVTRPLLVCGAAYDIALPQAIWRGLDVIANQEKADISELVARIAAQTGGTDFALFAGRFILNWFGLALAETSAQPLPLPQSQTGGVSRAL